MMEDETKKTKALDGTPDPYDRLTQSLADAAVQDAARVGLNHREWITLVSQIAGNIYAHEIGEGSDHVTYLAYCVRTAREIVTESMAAELSYALGEICPVTDSDAAKELGKNRGGY